MQTTIQTDQELSFYTLLSIWETGAALQHDIEVFLKKYGISHGRFSILLTLYRYRQEAVYPSVIADALKKRRPTITDMVKKLIEDGYVDEIGDAKDGRKKKLKLSRRGLGLLKTILPQYNERMDHFTKTLSSKDKKQLMKLIDQIKVPVMS